MKKTLTILLAMLIVTFSLVGCAKCISTETSTVQVKITDEYHRTAYTTMHYSLLRKLCYLNHIQQFIELPLNTME